MDENIKKEIHELHCYWSDVLNYPSDRRPDDIIVDIKKKLHKLENKLYSIKYKTINRRSLF